MARGVGVVARLRQVREAADGARRGRNAVHRDGDDAAVQGQLDRGGAGVRLLCGRRVDRLRRGLSIRRIGAGGAVDGGRRGSGGRGRGRATPREQEGCDAAARARRRRRRRVRITSVTVGHRTAKVLRAPTASVSASFAETPAGTLSGDPGTMAVMPAAPPTLVIITGEEELLVDRVVFRALATARRQDPDVERREAPAAGLSVGDFIELVAPSLFAEPRLVVIRSAQESSKELAAAVLDYAGDQVEGVTLLVHHSGGASQQAAGRRSAQGWCLPGARREDHQGGRAGRVRPSGRSRTRAAPRRPRRPPHSSTRSARTCAGGRGGRRNWSPIPAAWSTRRPCASTTAVAPR